MPPAGWRRVTTIEAHTAGEPLRVIMSGFPPIPGDSMPAKRRYAQAHLDELRTALMWEPRGHADMYGCILTEPVTPDGDAGILFMHNEGFSTMCGHGIIGIVKVGLEVGLFEKDEEQPVVRLDTPAGRVTAYATRAATGEVAEVAFDNVPSFVYALDQEVRVPEVGTVRYDIAFGGAFYALLSGFGGLRLRPDDHEALITNGRLIKQAIMAEHRIVHPFEQDLGFLYGVIFVGEAEEEGHHSRNVCVFADGEIDRSPTGTGVSARAALHYARGELQMGEPFVVESILGTTFTGMVAAETQFGPYPAVIPRVTGTAHITGRAEWLIDPSDPLARGFFLR